MSVIVRRPVRGRSASRTALAAVVLLAGSAVTGPAVATARVAGPSAPSCREFTRFGERWELCHALGRVEAHRLGVYPSGPR